MVFRCPLQQVQFDALQREFWCQERAKQLREAGNLKAGSAKPWSTSGAASELKPASQESSGDGLFLLTAALAAAPTVTSFLGKAAEAFFDTLLAEGDPALKQSHVTRFSQAAQIVLGTELTFDEETTLTGILKWIWESGDSRTISVAWQIITHSRQLSNESAAAWAERSRDQPEQASKRRQQPQLKIIRGWIIALVTPCDAQLDFSFLSPGRTAAIPKQIRCRRFGREIALLLFGKIEQPTRCFLARLDH